MRDLLEEIGMTIRRNKLRTALTGLSVAWGIFILIVLLGAGNGLIHAFQSASGTMATNVVEVRSSSTTLPFNGYPAGRHIDAGTSTTLAGECDGQYDERLCVTKFNRCLSAISGPRAVHHVSGTFSE